MNTLGSYLKDARKKCNLSLKDVHDKCGITDSRLSRAENKATQFLLNLHELKELATLYNINVITLFHEAGYIDNSDLESYQLVFQGASLLSEEERQLIQTQIDLFNRKKKVEAHDI